MPIVNAPLEDGYVYIISRFDKYRLRSTIFGCWPSYHQASAKLSELNKDCDSEAEEYTLDTCPLMGLITQE